MKIYVIRHGETRMNVEHRMQGWADEPLNEMGEKLAAETGRAMKEEGLRFDACFSSPLNRAVRTAEILLAKTGSVGVPVICDDRLKEIDMGAWEGRLIDPAAGEIDPVQVHYFFKDPGKFTSCPEGESFRQVMDRTQDFLKELVARDDGRTYLVSMHGCSLRAMLNCLYEDPSDYWHGHVPYNCVINVIEAEGGDMKLTVDDRVYYDPSQAVDLYSIEEK